LILCKNLSFAYTEDEAVLTDLQLELPSGLILLVGPNGCGKTTLLRLIAGVEMADSGMISINGFDLWNQEVKARSQLAYLPEYPDLTPYATIKEIVDLVCRLRGQSLKSSEKALQEIGLSHLKKRTVRELSNGERRRVIFACGLVGWPSVLLLDEPLDGMDSRIQQKILSWVIQHRDSGSTILLASHYFSLFMPQADQAVTIRNGQAVHHRSLPQDLVKKKSFLEKLAGN
jgi:ABC-2 type transport system ATP-binding protein